MGTATTVIEAFVTRLCEHKASLDDPLRASMTCRLAEVRDGTVLATGSWLGV